MENDNFVKKIRLSKGHTQKDMAQEMGVKREYISMLETGRRPITAEVKMRILAYYNCGDKSRGTSRQWRVVNKFMKEFSGFNEAFKKDVVHLLQNSA